jgi:hypothetical protein
MRRTRRGWSSRLLSVERWTDQYFRAYIAASRRSDRSLEARVESARRASEIHKRRTGRSLRVTEQDVVNEEMYEEEDDDLPLQYRRLTAHLQTNSVDFNRRLAAYLTNQVAMRSAMEQMVNNSYNQLQYPNHPQYAGHSQQAMYHSAMMNQHIAQSPTSAYRSAPYPSPHQSGFRQMHGRAYSMAAPNEVPSNVVTAQSPSMPSNNLNHRRMSTSAKIPTSPGPRSLDVNGVKPNLDHQRQTQSATAVQSGQIPGNFPPLWQDMGPFTTSLPPEAQQLLGPGLDPNDPFTSVLMAGSENYTSNPYYPWNNTQGSGKLGPMTPSIHPSYNGMSATLAPSALDSGTDALSATAPTLSPSNDNITAPSSGVGFNFSQESKVFNPYSTTGLGHDDSTQGLGSGQVTPGEGFWDSFVQEGGWTEEASAS